MRNTPPEPTNAESNNELLIERLGVALRNVGVWEVSLARGDSRALPHVQQVQEIHAILKERGVDVGPNVARLTTETGWRMDALLDEALRFPEVIPAVRGPDGVRRRHRCQRCGRAEFPDLDGTPLCNVCLGEAIAALEERRAFDGWVVFRTFSPALWCAHADSDTVLLTRQDDHGLCASKCADCLRSEVLARS
jgi:hypothetical protein